MAAGTSLALTQPAVGVVNHATYRPELDGVRFIAVLFVLADHALGTVIGWDAAGTIGWAGVTVFFALSGYLITGLLAAEHLRTGRVDLAAFYRRRARRLLPAFGLMLVVVTALAATGVVGPDWQLGLLASLSFTASWIRSAGIELGAFTHTWTLSVEWQFYLLWPLVFLVPYGPRLIAIALVALGVAWYAATPWSRAVYATPSSMAAIAFGAFLALSGVRLAWLAPLAPLAAPGRRAYSLYLWNWPMTLMLGPVGGLVATFAAAEVSYRVAERPFISRRSTVTP